MDGSTHSGGAQSDAEPEKEELPADGEHAVCRELAADQPVKTAGNACVVLAAGSGMRL